MVVALSMWSSQGDYKVLYANLSDKDGGAIIAQLSQMNVPYRHADGGAAILVPAAQVHDVRLKLASAGLPKGSVVGFELMDTARFGLTQFGERLNFQRGLEGELTRSITALAAVQGARVHLALPNQNGFFREQQKPSASVLLTLHPGRTLDRAQVAGIVHLVASSVAELSPKAVSVLDQTGALLSGPADAVADERPGRAAVAVREPDRAGLRQAHRRAARAGRRARQPARQRRRRDRLLADRIDVRALQAQPGRRAPRRRCAASRAPRSAARGASPPAGVPGATSNQPPQQATAPVTGAAAPLQAAQTGGVAAAPRGATASTNYEVDKTVRVTRNATGTVKRLNAAVVVNNRSVTDAKGKTTTHPLRPEEIEKLTALVRESIGFNKERGDSVKVINAPFRRERAEHRRTAAVEAARDDRPGARAGRAGRARRWSRCSSCSAWSARRCRRRATPRPRGSAARRHRAGRGEPAAGARQPRCPCWRRRARRAQLDQARQLAKQNPAAVASIVRDWVSGEKAA